MSSAQALRIKAASLFLGLAAMSGCTHNYYYYPTGPACPPTADISTVQYGDVCQVAPPIGSAVVAQAPGRTTVMSGPAGSRVVISQPQARGSRLAWRKPDPEGPITTRFAGDIGDEETEYR